MVREVGLEPTRLAALVPKTSVYTNFTTRASDRVDFANFFKKLKFFRGILQNYK